MTKGNKIRNNTIKWMEREVGRSAEKKKTKKYENICNFSLYSYWSRAESGISIDQSYLEMHINSYFIYRFMAIDQAIGVVHPIYIFYYTVLCVPFLFVARMVAILGV